jgi:hypothetical protein
MSELKINVKMFTYLDIGYNITSFVFLTTYSKHIPISPRLLLNINALKFIVKISIQKSTQFSKCKLI